MNQLLSMGAPGIQEIVVILAILAMFLVPVAIIAIVLVVCLRKKSTPPALPPKDPQDKE